jgi:hypothetical protein
VLGLAHHPRGVLVEHILERRAVIANAVVREPGGQDEPRTTAHDPAPS